MTINERILALRRAAGLSQEALAEQVGVSRQAIGKWESGASLPGLDNLQELARALGVSCDELLTGKESGTENTAGQDGVALESVKALLDAQNAAQAHAAHRQRILLAGLAAALACVGAALVYLGVYYGGRMRELSSRVDDIGANVAGIEGSIDMRISSIQSSIEESLRRTVDGYGHPQKLPRRSFRRVHSYAGERCASDSRRDAAGGQCVSCGVGRSPGNGIPGLFGIRQLHAGWGSPNGGTVPGIRFCLGLPDDGFGDAHRL